MQAIIFCGIQGAGKSTFYKQHFFNSHLRISLDLLRTRHRERLLLEFCFATRARFVVDNTNPTAEERLRYITAARAAEYEVVGYFFDAVLEKALLRNAARQGKEVVPDRGIQGTYKRLQPPQLSEGFNRLYHVRLSPNNTFLISEAL